MSEEQQDPQAPATVTPGVLSDDEPTGNERVTVASDAPAEDAPALGGDTVLDTLRRQYAEADGKRRKTLMIVPGRFNSMLAARYYPIEWTEQRKKIRKAGQQGNSEETELNYGAGVIAEACEEILIRTEPGGPLKPMHLAVKGMGDQPVRFDERLAAAVLVDKQGNPIDVSGVDPIGICRLVFKNKAALNQHFAEVDAFLREAVESDEDEDESAERPT